VRSEPHSNPIRRIVVADAQTPFVRGGAELHVEALVRQLRHRGYAVEAVALPFRGQNKPELLAQAAAWRMLDLTASHDQPIDLLIATRFPSYFVRHPRKVAWVIHQHRAAYELAGTPYSDFDHTESDVGLRKTLIDLDTRMLRECRRVFANARNTANRLETYNGIAAEALYHPPTLADRLRPGRYGEYFLVVGRLEAVKRIDLAVRAMAWVSSAMTLKIIGDGSQRAALEHLAAELGLGRRIEFLGAASDDELVSLYADARGVIYTPFDEDFGYVTLEAFLSGKPVITAADSGGPLEFVVDGENGFVTAPDAAAIGAALARLADEEPLARQLGTAGQARARQVTWDGVVEQLLG
jgi:glycosyltransferase involved in cell wall biosynthesis